MYIEITNTNDIKTAQKEMAINLKRQFPYEDIRKVGWPSGHFEAHIRFANHAGDDVSWWYSWDDKGKSTIYNLFGRGKPGVSTPLFIDLQFNHPLMNFNRKHGGVFLRDTESGMVLIGHRGIVTRGKARVNRDVLLHEANVSPEDALSDVRPGKVEILLVSPISDRMLGKRISRFSAEMRRAAYVVMGEVSRHKTTSDIIKEKFQIDIALKDYYDEFSGQVKVARKTQITMNCHHGDVVKALREKLFNKGKQYKSVAMDLVIETENKVFLYEVKTGTGTQTIYTGIGQLYFHSAVLARIYPSKRIIRTLVAPFDMADVNKQRICEELGVEIVTFKMSGSKVNIH